MESRFEVLPIANGVVLTPRFRTAVKSIELSDSTIAIDGTPVTGSELRERLGNDAELVLQLSYLTPAARRALAAGGDATRETRRRPRREPLTARRPIPTRRRSRGRAGERKSCGLAAA